MPRPDDPSESSAAPEVSEPLPLPETAAKPTAPSLPPDIAWLFRRALAEGRMHPLLPLLLRYRHGLDLPRAPEGGSP